MNIRRFFATRVEFAKTFMPRKGFGGKLKLSQFLKFTHPDKFSEAGAQVQAHNANSVKQLNQYLASVQANTGVQELDLEFYVRKPKIYKEEELEQELESMEIKSKLLSLFQNSENPELLDTIEEEIPIFKKFSIRLLSLRANSSESLRRKHYENAIDSLNQSLAECLEKLKRSDIISQQYEDEDHKIHESEMKTPWDAKVRPYKKGREKLEREKNELVAILSELIDEEAKAAARDKAVTSIYKSVFNLPKSVQMSEPGYEFKRVINNTTALNDFAELIKTPIDPRLIYFHHQLSETTVQSTIQFLKGQHLPEQQRMQFLRGLQSVAIILHKSDPPIFLFFQQVDDFNIDKIPGFIVLNPFFDVNKLKHFAEKNYRQIVHNSEKFLKTQIDFEQFEKKFKHLLDIRDIKYSEPNSSLQAIDANMLCLKHFKKFALTHTQEVNRLLQILSAQEGNPTLVIGSKFAVRNLKEIEIPQRFQDEALLTSVVESRKEIEKYFEDFN